MVNSLDPSGITRGDTETEQDFRGEFTGVTEVAGVTGVAGVTRATEVTGVTVVPPWKEKWRDIKKHMISSVLNGETQLMECNTV